MEVEVGERKELPELLKMSRKYKHVTMEHSRERCYDQSKHWSKEYHVVHYSYSWFSVDTDEV